MTVDCAMTVHDWYDWLCNMTPRLFPNVYKRAICSSSFHILEYHPFYSLPSISSSDYLNICDISATLPLVCSWGDTFPLDCIIKKITSSTHWPFNIQDSQMPRNHTKTCIKIRSAGWVPVSSHLEKLWVNMCFVSQLSSNRHIVW